jgi:hypothetical protein
MDEDEICFKAKEIARALRRSQNDPIRIPDASLRDLVLETYEYVGM